ncbi:hypothetical protein NliqN6_1691 [Naganishia liquefaciens]|uniref:FCP1 homology domain-containing protein n=1 Tax=Naganishia liquefaciens TaxID=104408 RepID=A0A8H3TQV1_9TREE|nr:hypothetical protein NliqN6_1691 [Naganishia liquefaciens]
MQGILRGMENVSVTGEVALTPQKSGSRGTYEREIDERGLINGMNKGRDSGSRGSSRESDRTSRPAAHSQAAEDWKREAISSRSALPQSQRYDEHHFGHDETFSHRSRTQDQQSWRPPAASRSGDSFQIDSAAILSPHNGGARFPQEGHSRADYFPKSRGTDLTSGRSASPVNRQGRRSSSPVGLAGSLPRSIDGVNPLPINHATKLIPITRTSAVPAHLQHPFRMLEPGTRFDISAALSAERVTERQPTPEVIAMAQVSPNIYSARPLEKGFDARSTRKLVVLDLNGALLVRSKRSNIPLENVRREVYPRPFLAPFLAYILEAARPIGSPSNPRDLDEQVMRPYEAFVWSSAQPINVDGMIRKAFRKWGMPSSPRAEDREMCERMLRRFDRVENRPGRVLGVWTRDEMDLTKAQYGQKSLTYKDLQKVAEHFQTLGYMSAQASRSYRPDPDFSPSLHSTLLVDDSTVKACMQPFNHIPIPEYTLESLNATQAVLQRYQARAGKEDASRDPSEYVHQATNSSVGILEQVFGPASAFFPDATRTAGRDKAPKLDGILLGVIGILDELKDVVNLPAWIAAGGLTPTIEETFTQEIAARGWQCVTSLDMGPQASVPVSDNGYQKRPPHMVPTVLPSHPEYNHWYESPQHLLYWVRRGLVALQERHIDPLNLE